MRYGFCKEHSESFVWCDDGEQENDYGSDVDVRLCGNNRSAGKS